VAEIGRAAKAIRALLLLSTLLEARAQDAAPAPTFNRDVAPILFQHCSACHRPGQVAPFSLLTYGDVRKRTRQILGMVESRQMPPWKPEPDHGEFEGENRLRDDEIALLRRWVEEGGAEGEARDLPPVPEHPEGWNFGEPDLVVTVPEPYMVSSEERNTYRAFVIPLNLPEDKYVRAFQFRPSNPRVVHHALMYLDTTGEYRRMDEAEAGPGFTAPALTSIFSGGCLGVWNPGCKILPFGEGMAKEIRKNSDLVLHVHYYATGKPERDQSSVGFWFAKEAPRRKVDAVILNDQQIRIPAGAKSARLMGTVKMPADADVIGIGPHAHYLAREVRVWAKTPDGREVPMIWIKDWDFEKQGEYRFKKALRLPKDTEIRMLWVYDNSADNPRNPSNPPRNVEYGIRSEDEMARLLLRIAPDRPEDLLKFHFALRIIKRD